MRTIIAGSRGISDPQLVDRAITNSRFIITQVLCGMARGADLHGFAWAIRNQIPVVEFHADWDRFGRSAGAIRNGEMSLHADALIALWDGKSRGTKNMIDVATRAGLKVYVETP